MALAVVVHYILNFNQNAKDAPSQLTETS